MAEHPVPRAPQTGKPSPSAKPGRSTKPGGDEPPATPKQVQAIAHSRGRICKVRGCEICAPLRERRRLKKAQRKADAQVQLHAKGEPCGRSNCPVPACVKARHADDVIAPAMADRAIEPEDDSAEVLRRQQERHRAGLPCGLESCPSQLCVDGFTQERARRHRAGRPCKSTDCANTICVASRSGS